MLRLPLRYRLSVIFGQDLLKFLTELLGEAACDSDVAYICDLLQITDETKVDLEIFSVTAAVTERLLYPQFVYVPWHPLIYVQFFLIHGPQVSTS